MRLCELLIYNFSSINKPTNKQANKQTNKQGNLLTSIISCEKRSCLLIRSKKRKAKEKD